jgi:ABC-type multidrug transport system fused ATPase/permease subunit
MSSDRRHKDKSNSQFWRACRYLHPYRGLVVISVVCALFVSVAFAGGLGTLLPIMRVFLNGDTIQTWVNREIAQRRIGVSFADQTDQLQIVKVSPEKPAAQAGLKIGDVLTLPSSQNDPAAFAQTLAALSEPRQSSIHLQVRPGNVASLSLPPVPFYMAIGRGISTHFPSKPVPAIAAVLGFVLTLAVFSNILSFFQEYLSDKAAVLAVNDIRRRFYDHVLHIPLSHFGQKGTSDTTSRLTQDAQNLAEGFKTVLGQSIQEPIKAAMAFGIALLTSWKLTMFIVVFAPIMLVIIKKFGKKMRRASKSAMLSSSSMLGQIEGSLSGIRVVKGATAERFERRRYSRIMGNLVTQQLRMSRIDAFTEPTMATLNLVVISALVLVASSMVLTWHTLGRDQFILVMACLGAIADSLRRVSKVNNVLQRSNAAAARIFEVLDLPMERERRRKSAAGTRGHGDAGKEAHDGNGSAIASSLPRIKLPPMQREIRFEGVTFTYPNGTNPAVVDVNLDVPKGKSIAVVGHNGSGKTTLLALLPRFYDPQEGRILIDGVDIRHLTLRSLRSQISIVTQDSVIFPGSIAENIAYGNPLASREEIVAAARRAFAHEFILEKAQGYDTLLGEMGGQLSGGQKQRLCIARAILRKSPILVLDEATSQVDAHNEDLIQRAIESVMKERTTFVIAHRFSTIRSADEIVVMDRGRIVGQGRHDELLVTCDTYQQLYERQLFTMPSDSAKVAVEPVA